MKNVDERNLVADDLVPVRTASDQAAETEHRARVVDPLDVQTRQHLHEYLGQSITEEYKFKNELGGVSQRTTFVKSYIVEVHPKGSIADSTFWSQAFIQVLPRQDESLLLLIDRKNVAYFADLSDSRFIVLHSIGKTDTTDNTLTRLTQGGTEGFDRAWMPSDFLYGSRRGPLRGFKFGHLAAVSGINGVVFADDEVELFVHDDGVDDTKYGIETAEDSAVLDVHDDSTYFARHEQGDAVSRLTVSNTVTADHDFHLIRGADVFEGRQALDSIQFVTADDQDFRLNANTYSTGKIVGSGTSLGLHLLVVESIRSAYGRTIRSIEDDFAMGWTSSSGGLVRHGEPLIVTFPEGLITDLSSFVRSLFSPSLPFRLFGVFHRETDERVDIEAIDLHTNDPLSLEVTKSWMRVYLPKGSCGNIVARLYTNLQHSAHSDIGLVSGDGIVLLSESDAKDG
jgi:hypothetical protein